MTIQRDITDRKMAEEELLILNQHLHKRDTELVVSNTELERFAYVASHDLHEPLRMVSSFMQLLKKNYETQLDAKAGQYISFAVDGADLDNPIGYEHSSARFYFVENRVNIRY